MEAVRSAFIHHRLHSVDSVSLWNYFDVGVHKLILEMILLPFSFFLPHVPYECYIMEMYMFGATDHC